MTHDDDVVSEAIFACSPEASADLDATLVGAELRQRGAHVRWVDVLQTMRSGRVRWLTRGTWPEAAEDSPGGSRRGADDGMGGQGSAGRVGPVARPRRGG